MKTLERLRRVAWGKPQNILSASRVPLGVLMLVLALAGVARGWLLGVLIIAALTDFLDGIVARMRGEGGPEGAFVDGLADYAFYPLLYASLVILNPGLFSAFLLPIALLLAWWVVDSVILVHRLGSFVIFHLHSMRFSAAAGVGCAFFIILDVWAKEAMMVTLLLFAVRLAEELVVYAKARRGTDPDVRFFWQVK